jgi:para-nitrobenzyl esterase
MKASLTLLVSASLGALIALPLAALAANDAAQQVQIRQGKLRAVAQDGVIAFKGIPYAAAPVGAHRWQPPVPSPGWHGVRDAGNFGADCMQKRVPWDPTQSSLPVAEDCLSANVWVAAGAQRRLPVMVWIHGGGFVMGSGSQPIFDGTQFARRGVVLVTFNYRLGRFGFFAHPALLKESADAASGNFAFMDQISLLRWVHLNIAAFGGDPGNVTIFGESAGGGSVLRMMLAPQARGLFQRAIVASGGGRDVLPDMRIDRPDKPSAASVGERFAASAGVAAQDVAGLRALPAAVIAGDLDLLNAPSQAFSGPMIDGLIVASDTSVAFAAAQQASVPLMIGCNSDELGALPAMFLKPINDKAALPFAKNLDSISAAYGSAELFAAHFASDVTFVEPAYFLARAATRGAAAGTAPVYLYQFGYVPAAQRGVLKGAPHASDLRYQFNTLAATEKSPAPDDQAMADLMQAYWVAFASSGVPSVPDQAQWPRFTVGAEQEMIFDVQGARVQAAGSPVLKAIAAAMPAAAPIASP